MMTCTNCNSEYEPNTGATHCSRCGAAYPRSWKDRKDEISVAFMILSTVTAAIAVSWKYGWPWAIVGAWGGFLLASLFGSRLGGMYLFVLTVGLFMVTTCLVGPIEVFLLIPSPWRWIALLWLAIGVLLFIISMNVFGGARDHKGNRIK